MKKIASATGMAFAFAALAACNSTAEDPTITKTSSAGNAIAANTVMQMVDPWPEGVDDTRLKTPAEYPKKPADASEKPDSGSKTTK